MLALAPLRATRAVREHGIEAIADAVMGRYFHDGFRAAHGAIVARFRQRLVTTDAPGYDACCNAVGKVDTTARLAPSRRRPW
jgi:3-oxoadipate enol-lactonase